MKSTRKSVSVFILILACFSAIALFTQPVFAYDKPLVINHLNTKITSLSQADIENAKAKLHIAYGHTSHGSQLVTGMSGLIAFANNHGLGLNLPTNIFSYNNGGASGALDLRDTPFGGSYDLGAPDRTTWATVTRTYLSAHPETNVIIWSWCGQADTTEANINIYLNLMNQLEADYPDVKFVYMTGHLVGTGLNGNLHLRNEQIRNYCRINNKILYDFEDIESYDPDGGYYGDKIVNDACDYDSNADGARDRNWATDWQNAHTLNVDWYSCTSAHSQPLNANQKAYAAWALWTQIARIGENNPPAAQDISVKVIKDTQNSTLNRISLQASDVDVKDTTLTYTVLSLPAHGQLKEADTDQDIPSVPYSLSSNKVKYIPDTNYIGTDSFTYKANDSKADSNTATVSLRVVQWFAPIGIPEPSFGIKETYRMYDDPAKRNPSLTYTQNAEGGYYTHYIDNTSPAATDTNNTYGTQVKPRLTIPTILAAGSVVEIHNSVAGTGLRYITADGSAASPIFVRGYSAASKPLIQGGILVKQGYSYWENLVLHNGRIEIRPHNSSTAHHVCVRGNEMYGDGLTTTEAGVGVYGATGNVIHDVVIYDNHIHHGGDCTYNGENDVHGVGVPTYAQNIWVIDNHIHHMGGDSFQSGHGANWTVNYVYVGRNIMHDDGENAVDLKDLTDVVISENVMYSFHARPGADAGTITVTHYGASDPATRGTVRAWFLFNECYDADQAAHQVSSGPQDIYYIGNIIHDIAGYAFNMWAHENVSILGNTMERVDVGIDDTGGADVLAIVDNIFGLLNSPMGTHITLQDSTHQANAVVRNNLFQEPIRANVSSLDSLEGDPLFVDPMANNFRLQAASPAIDKGTSTGTVQQAFDRFQQLYGLDIRKDNAGTARPQDSGWDIGAYEYVAPGAAIVYGDVSGDGEASAYDAALTAQAAVGLINLTADQIQAADVSGDGEVGAYDAALIAQKAVGLIDKFPAEG